MVMDRELLELVRARDLSANHLRAAAEAKGMLPLMADGVGKVLDGSTSVSELLAISVA